MRDAIQSEKERVGMWFQEEHLSAFRNCVHANHHPDDGITKKGQAFAEGLPHVDVEVLPEKAVKRSDVLELAGNPDVNVPTVSAAIMAWGGMQKRFRDMLFKGSGEEWLQVAEEIRSGTIDRMTAYGRFRELRRENKLKGAGPAYFTKLIYFFTPRPSATLKMGYIMDQWAGCSINLLVGREVVLMNIAKTWKEREGSLYADFSFNASDRNTEKNYEEFCSMVDRLASCLGCTPEKVDRELVSSGRQSLEDWREYVLEHRQRFICTGVERSGD